MRIVSPAGRGYRAGLDWLPDGTWLLVHPFGPPSGLELIRVANGESLPLHFAATLEQPAWRPAGP